MGRTHGALGARTRPKRDWRKDGALEATPTDVIRRQFDVNLFGLSATTQEVLGVMRPQRSGVIVNVSSVGGRMCYPLGALYHGSKWAVEGLSEALHFELIPLGIRVKLVEPGGVATDFGGRSFVFTHDESMAKYQPMAQAVKTATENMDTSSFQKPEEVAGVIWEAVNDETRRMRFVSGNGAAVEDLAGSARIRCATSRALKAIGSCSRYRDTAGPGADWDRTLASASP